MRKFEGKVLKIGGIKMSRHGKLYTTYTKSGLRRYEIEIWQDELKKYQVIRGDNKYVVEQKARAKMAQWEEMWERKEAAEQARFEREQRALDKEQKLRLAADKTQEAQASIAALENILAHTLGVDDAVDWETLKNLADYPVAKPEEPKIEREPQSTDSKYQPELGLLDKIIKSRKIEKLRVRGIIKSEHCIIKRKNRLAR